MTPESDRHLHLRETAQMRAANERAGVADWWQTETQRLASQADPATVAALGPPPPQPPKRSPRLGVTGGDRQWREVPNEPEDDGKRSIVFTAASSIIVRPVRWIWDARMAAGTLVLLGGREGIGKSTVAYQVAADVTRGALDGVFYGVPKSVVVAATEDSWEHTIVPRLMAAGADLDRVYRVGVVTSAGYAGSLSLPNDLHELETKIGQVDAAMVLLDPLMSRLDAKLDSHKDAEVRLALEPLVALADRCHVAVVGLIHVNKSSTTDPLSMLMASRAFAAVARSVLFVTVDPDDERTRILGLAKNNLGRTDLPSRTFNIDGVKVADTDEGPVWTARLTWKGEDTRSIEEVLRSVSESGDVRSATAEAAAWLTDYLEQHKVAASQTVKAQAKADGISPDSLKRARQKISAGATSAGFPRRTYWSAPGLTPEQVDVLLADLQSEQTQ